MSAKAKQLVVEVEDETKANLIEQIEVRHLSDVGDGVKQVVENFVEQNGGTVFPPVSIEVTELEEEAGGGAGKSNRNESSQRDARIRGE